MMRETKERSIDDSLRKLDMTEMGKRIRERRLFLSMSREELGVRLGVSVQFIADIESGSKGVSLKRLYALCQILGVTADYILAGECLEENDDLLRAREKVMGILCRCDADQLRGIEKIVSIFADGTRTE